MRRYLLPVLAFAVTGIVAGPRPKTWRADDQQNLYVSTAGGEVHGTIDQKTPDVRQFLGIPYAQPPVGNLRFAPPVAASKFDYFEATTLPASCMQFLGTEASVYTRNVLQFNVQGLNTTGNISEDCLTLSVWTPANATAASALPVLMFVYGGAFLAGGENTPYQLPPQWVQSTQDHIVVSFNYRINMFGFPNAAGLNVTGQNLGLMDQRIAVEWVRDNIAQFGGDPTRIGLWGQSAGAISVAFYSYAWFEDPIVNSIMMDSGTEYSQIVGPVFSTNFTFVAEGVGCGNLEPAAELACMRLVDAFVINDFLTTYGDIPTNIPLLFVPVADENTTFSNFTERAINGQVAKIPAIIGNNVQDGVPFAPYNPNGPNMTLADEALLGIFFCPGFKEATNRLVAGVPTFRYQYYGNFSNISPTTWLGAYHSSELPMLFGTHSLFRGNSTDFEFATSAAMQDAWLSIVSGGADGLAAQGWPAYANVTDGQVRVFGNGTTASNGNTQLLEAACAPLLPFYA